MGFKAWMEDGSVTGVESGALSVMGEMREIIGIQSGGVVGIESGGVELGMGGFVGVESGGVTVDMGGGTIAFIAMGFGILLVIVIVVLICVFKKVLVKGKNPMELIDINQEADLRYVSGNSFYPSSKKNMMLYLLLSVNFVFMITFVVSSSLTASALELHSAGIMQNEFNTNAIKILSKLLSTGIIENQHKLDATWKSDIHDALMHINGKLLNVLPLGTILSWVKTPDKNSFRPAILPEGWIRCDGKKIPSGSIWSGMKTPNLNGENR